MASLRRLRVFQVSNAKDLGPAQLGGAPLSGRCFLVQTLSRGDDNAPEGGSSNAPKGRPWLHIARAPRLSGRMGTGLSQEEIVSLFFVLYLVRVRRRCVAGWLTLSPPSRNSESHSGRK
jgi:hypothetical protein